MLGVLSALGKYGLLEGRGNDSRVSDLAVQIIAHPPGTAERAAALSEAAGRPELFAELDSRFQGGKASDQAIRAYLLTQKFIPSAADAAIRAYRETKALVLMEAGGYMEGKNGEQRPLSQASDLMTVPRSSGASLPPLAQPASPAVMPPQALPPLGNQSSVNLGDDFVEVSARIFDQAAMQKLIEKLTAIKSLLPEAPTAVDPTPIGAFA